MLTEKIKKLKDWEQIIFQKKERLKAFPRIRRKNNQKIRRLQIVESTQGLLDPAIFYSELREILLYDVPARWNMDLDSLDRLVLRNKVPIGETEIQIKLKKRV